MGCRTGRGRTASTRGQRRRNGTLGCWRRRRRRFGPGGALRHTASTDASRDVDCAGRCDRGDGVRPDRAVSGGQKAKRSCSRHSFCGDAGSGTMLTLGIGASFLIVTFLLVPLLGGFVIHQRAQGAADLAALAAADVASGRQPGNPCVTAEILVGGAGFSMRECRLEQLISRVTVTTNFGPFEVVARARAGPSSAM